MTAKQKKLFLLTSMMSVFVMAAAVLFAGGKLSMSPLGVRGTTETVEGSITWNATNSEKTTHAGNRVSYLRHTQRGTGIYAYSYGQYNASNDYMLDSKGSDYQTFGIFISSAAGTSSSLFQFQNITSVSVTTASGSASGATFKVFTNSTSEGTAAYTGTSDGTEQVFNLTTQVSGAKYLAIRPSSINLEIKIKSITVNYSCEPGGVEPSPDTYGFTFYSFDGDNVDELYGVDESSLPSSAEAGESVEFEVEMLSGYAFYYAFEYSDVISDWSLSGSTISFTMPEHDVEICIMVETEAVVLDSISISGYTTEYSVNDLFEFDGVVTAFYSDGTDEEVEPTDVSEPDMSTSGTKEVVVSYTDGGVTKTASYNISVGEATISLSGRFNYSSRTGGAGPSYNELYIVFNSNGTGEWHATRLNARDWTDTTYPYDTVDTYSVCYFDYEVEMSGSNFAVTFTLTGYDLHGNKANSFSGGTSDRPFPSFTLDPAAVNNTCVVNSAKTSLTIDTFQSGSYFGTCTYTLAS